MIAGLIATLAVSQKTFRLCLSICQPRPSGSPARGSGGAVSLEPDSNLIPAGDHAVRQLRATQLSELGSIRVEDLCMEWLKQ